MTGSPDGPLRDYIEAIAPEHRPLFDRVHRLVLEAWPDAVVGLSYGMPTFRAGGRRLHVGVWKHGVSLYGWRGDDFLTRHPELRAAKATIRLSPADADQVTDEELRALARQSLAP